MLSVGFQGKSNVYFNNRNKLVTNSAKSQNNIVFKGNAEIANFSVFRNLELKFISSGLKKLGVRELELGDNIHLARLLNSAMKRVKQAGFDVPTRIRCESKIFREDKDLAKSVGVVDWDGLKEPILYLRTSLDWKNDLNIASNTKDPQFPIWHEIGHWLHMKNHTKERWGYLKNISMNQYQRDIVKKTIGGYAASNGIPDIIAEIFARLMSGESYDKLHPELFNIYSKYNGPMPRFKPNNAG